MAQKSSIESEDKIPSYPLNSNNDPNTSKDINMQEQKQQHESHVSKTLHCNKEKLSTSTMDDDVEKELTITTSVVEREVLEEESERERLKRHRVEVAGRIWIPEIWGQEDFLKDWIDCTAFDAPLVPSKITMARAALVQEVTTPNVAPLRKDNRSLEYDNVNMDLSLNNNCTNVEVQNNEVFRCQEEPLNKKIRLKSTDI